MKGKPALQGKELQLLLRPLQLKQLRQAAEKELALVGGILKRESDVYLGYRLWRWNDIYLTEVYGDGSPPSSIAASPVAPVPRASKGVQVIIALSSNAHPE